MTSTSFARQNALICFCFCVVLCAASGRAQDFDASSDFENDAEGPESQERQLLDLFEEESTRTELKLNNEQRTKIDAILEKHQTDAQQLKQRFDDELKSITSVGERLRKRAEFNREIRESTLAAKTEAESQLIALLDSDQKTALEEKIQALKISPASPAQDRGRPDDPDKMSKTASQEANSPAREMPPTDDGKAAVASFGAGTTTAADDQTPSDGNPQASRLTFSFHKAPWSEVLKLFADSADLSLNLRDVPPGTFSYLDRQEYTPTEALDIMNRYLLQEGFLLVRHDRFLTVFNTKNGIPPNLIETVTPEELETRGKPNYCEWHSRWGIAMPIRPRGKFAP